MKPAARLRSISAWLLLLGTGVGTAGAQVESSPALEQLAERTAGREANAATTATEKRPPHEAILTPAQDRAPVYADKVPPARIAERPGESAPGPNFQWIQGYWDWDATRKEFVWVTGTWRVPPPGKFWVDGFWRRVDEKGWRRVAGFWSERRAAPSSETGAGGSRDWRRLGPPAKRPSETIGTAPAPDFFYIPGEFVPRAEEVAWRPGFWYRSQPGWEWNPAHWIRQAAGWDFREGSWSRTSAPPTFPPGGGPGLRAPGPTLVSMPAGSAPAPNGTAPNPVLSTNPTGAPPGPTGTTPPNAGAADRQESDPALAEGETPAAADRPTQANGTTPAGSGTAAPAPGQYGSQPRYYYPGNGMPYNYSPYGGMGRFGGIAGYINQFLPF